MQSASSAAEGASANGALTGGSILGEPSDLVRLCLDELVYVKLRGERELVGRLHGYDQHLNMVVGDAEETVMSTEVDEETFEQIVRTRKRKLPLVFVRGDTLILISPLFRQSGASR